MPADETARDDAADDDFLADLTATWSKESVREGIDELSHHPLFARSNADVAKDSTFEALQALNFTEDDEKLAENTFAAGNRIVTERLGPAAQEDWKQFRYLCIQALKKYEEALQHTFRNELKARILANVSLVQTKLKNYRDVIECCDRLLALRPEAVKGYYRKARALQQLERVEEARAVCATGLAATNAEELRQLDEELRALEVRHGESLHQKKNEQSQQWKRIAARCATLGCTFVPGDFSRFPQFSPEIAVRSGRIVCSVFFLYPEFSQADFVREAAEEDTVFAVFVDVLGEGLPWDRERCYADVEGLELVVVTQTSSGDEQRGKRNVIGRDMKLEDVMRLPDFVLMRAIEVLVVAKNSPFYTHFASQFSD